MDSLGSTSPAPPLGGAATPPPSASAGPTLSRRELDVLDRLARGGLDKEVARELGISLGSVRVYRARTMRKLGTRGLIRTALVAWRLGLFDLEAVADEAMAQRLPPRDPYFR